MSPSSLFPKAKINGEGVPEITCDDLFAHQTSVKMIDVRRPEEFTGELGHIEGSTLCTLETEFQATLNKLNKDDTYVFVCRSGMRSSRATAYALSLGFKNVYNLEGGMIAWNSKKLPIAK
jgi:hydroxyacylglutathione hydrolase